MLMSSLIRGSQVTLPRLRQNYLARRSDEQPGTKMEFHLGNDPGYLAGRNVRKLCRRCETTCFSDTHDNLHILCYIHTPVSIF